MIIACILFVTTIQAAQSLIHPHIWVKNSEKVDILAKIDNEKWATDLFNQYKSRVDPKKNSHKVDPTIILNTIPGFPGDQKLHREVLTLGYESALLYWLTGEDDYGQLAADILAEYAKQISAISGTVHFTTGTSYSHLVDTREAYTKPPMIYDFVHGFLKKSTTKVYDKATGNSIAFNFTKAQNSFIKLADGVFNEGSINSNHPILEAPGALFNLLSIEDDAKRATYMNKFMVGTPNQNGLTWMMDECKKSTVWPEATGYSIGPHRIILELMNVVDLYDPSLKIIDKNKDLVKNAFLFENYRFPNNQNVMRFGDAHRNSLNTISIMERVLVMADRKAYGTIKNDALEMLKALYKDKGGYEPKVSTQTLEWNNPYYLLWGMNIPSTNVTPVIYNRSINIDYAGIAMQRNINTSDRSENGLMAYTGGAHYVHSHLTGIDMELYGLGGVMGTGGGDVGAANRSDIVFTDYHRIFAGHNTVIVNGGSKGDGAGAWKADNLLMQATTKTVAAEPASLEPAISEYFSFSSQLLDDNINNAKQQRVLSVIRTGDKTGYYFDLFRSKSNGTNNFHDYVYHNVGDGVQLVDDNNATVALTAKPDRYNSTKVTYKTFSVMFPGWHYFEDVKTSAQTTSPVKATIAMTKEGKRYMHMLMPGGESREYTSAKGPETIEGQFGYEKEKTPIVTIRHYGEAWTKPFISVFEPSRSATGSVTTIENVLSGTKIVGAKVTSIVDGKTIVDYVISNENGDDTYTSTTPAITFNGRFAIVREEDNKTTLYIGDGTSLIYGSTTLIATDRKGVQTIDNSVGKTAPVVTIAAPTTKEVICNVGDKMYVQAGVVDDNLVKAELYVDGELLRKEGVAPYEWGNFQGANNPTELDTLSVGSHIIKVIATDANGLTGEASFTLIVKEANTPPKVSIVSPANIDNVILKPNYNFNLKANVFDAENNVDYLILSIDNVKIRKDGGAPYEWGDNTSTLADTTEFDDLTPGKHTIKVVATDKEGAQDSVSFEVTVEAEKIAPIVTFIHPISDSVYFISGDKMYVNANVVDDNIVKTELFIDGVFVRKESVAPYEWGNFQGANNPTELDTLPVGTHTVKVVATDADGLTGEAAFTFIVEDGFTAVTNQIELLPELISLYPNPAKRFVYVRSSIEGELSLYDITGSVVEIGHELSLHGSPTKIDISHLKSGIYYVVIKSGKRLDAVKSFYLRR